MFQRSCDTYSPIPHDLCNFIDDGSVVATCTLGTTTGDKDTGALTVSVATGSKCNLRDVHGSNNRLRNWFQWQLSPT